MLDNENTRYIIRQNVYFGKFFAVFTDSKDQIDLQIQKEKRAGEFISALLESD